MSAAREYFADRFVPKNPRRPGSRIQADIFNAGIDVMLEEARAKAFKEARRAVEGERLRDDLDNATDHAYNQAISDAIRAVNEAEDGSES